MKKFWFRIPLALSIFGLWVLLVFPLSLQDSIIGVLITLFFILVPLPGSEVYGELKLVPKKIGYGIVYIFIFLWAVVKSNIQIALIVLTPKMPINPGIVEVKTTLKSRLGRLCLANSITLTPGTITVDVKGDSLFIHWINIESVDPQEATDEIVKGFEKYLEVIFG
ncbi:MAG: Na+/H+ antiporter subunit E [Spirochaetaceae bacterium]